MMAGPGLVTAVRQTAELARRSVLAERRQLLNILPGLVFPLLLAAVYSRQFSRALAMPGFPEVDSFLDFILPACVVQAVSFGATAAGTELALDIENGFFDRLVASPVARFPMASIWSPIFSLSPAVSERAMKFSYQLSNTTRTSCLGKCFASAPEPRSKSSPATTTARSTKRPSSRCSAVR